MRTRFDDINKKHNLGLALESVQFPYFSSNVLVMQNHKRYRTKNTYGSL